MFQLTMMLFVELFCIQGLFRTQSVGGTLQHRSTKKGRAGASVHYLSPVAVSLSSYVTHSYLTGTNLPAYLRCSTHRMEQQTIASLRKNVRCSFVCVMNQWRYVRHTEMSLIILVVCCMRVRNLYPCMRLRSHYAQRI